MQGVGGSSPPTTTTLRHRPRSKIPRVVEPSAGQLAQPPEQLQKARGCRFSLDDFGSGVSSFLYLKSLPVDFLKIDGQFASHVTTDPVDRSMVEAIAKIGSAMRVATIAEKVESAEVLEVLRGIGVDYIQGFHLAEPCSVVDVLTGH